MGGVEKGAGRTIGRLSAITQNRSGRREIKHTVDRPFLITQQLVKGQDTRAFGLERTLQIRNLNLAG
ncbi:hypothetical protein D3C87_1290800 [compost metagenome]